MTLNTETLKLLYLLKQNHPHTYLHSINVANYSISLGERLGLDEESLEKLKLVGLLHDIGKLNIPVNVLRKPGKLTEEEFEVIKNHPVYSVELLKRAGFIDEEVLRSIKAHHERIDGTGYPRSLKGNKIPFFAKIVSIADSYEAMTSDRCYRKGKDLDYVRNEFLNGIGNQFDPKITLTFLKLLDDEFLKVKKVEGIGEK